ncbi:MAG: archaellin/type IV pilin N-terminal domain-containing protein [Nitrosopumilaceae archaeon]
MDKSIQKTIRSRRAVAPIIATLLLIAIAVIGGVMIYVFTQGFFGDSSISRSPSADTISLSGYDMREIPAATGIEQHENTPVVGMGDAGAAGMANNEEGALFIRNLGENSYTISKLEVNGRLLTFDGTGVLTGGEWGMITVPDTATTTAGVAFQGAATILAGETGTLVVSFDGDGAGGNDNNAAAGRTIPVKITSSSGSVYNFNVVTGSKE